MKTTMQILPKPEIKRKPPEAPKGYNKPSKLHEDLKHLPNFQQLAKGEKRFLKAFFPKRFICRSTIKLGEMFNSSRASARETIDSWIKKGWIVKENRHHKDKSGQKGKAFKSNYYRILPEGEKHLKKLLNFLFEGYQENNLTPEKVQKIFNTRQHSITNVIKNKPREGISPSSPFSFKWNLSLVSSTPKSLLNPTKVHEILKGQTYSESLKTKNLSPLCLDSQNLFKKSQKFRAIQKLFCQIGFNKFFDKAYKGTLLKLLTISIENIKKLLKLIHKKISKGWKLRHFWGFFMSEIKKLPDKRRFADPWFKMLSKEYRDASDGKNNRLSDGVDTSIIAQGIAKLEKETGEKASEKVLERFLYHGTQKFKTAIDAICYRMELGRGELPQEKAITEEATKIPKGRPIYKQVKINLQTKQPYTDDDFLAGKPFAMVNKIIGYEPIKEKPQPKKKEPKKTFNKINSWVGLTLYAMKMGSVEAINKAFFEKREAIV